MNQESRPKAAPEDLAGGLIYSDSNADLGHSRERLADFYIAREEIAAARDAARDRARSEGRPIRPAEVDEQLRVVDDGGPLDEGSAVGND